MAPSPSPSGSMRRATCSLEACGWRGPSDCSARGDKEAGDASSDSDLKARWPWQCAAPLLAPREPRPLGLGEAETDGLVRLMTESADTADMASCSEDSDRHTDWPLTDRLAGARLFTLSSK